VTLVARITFLVLVGATFAAFFVAQRLKSAPPVITVASLNRDFSPARHPQEFSVFLKTDDDVTVDVVTQDGDRVRRLADDVHVLAHRALRLQWDGRRDDGTRAPDGNYRIRVSLRNEGRSTVIQRTMTLDTKPPSSEVCVGTPCSTRANRNLENVVAPSAKSVKVYVKGISQAYRTRFTVYRTDGAKPVVVDHFQVPRGSHRGRYTGPALRQPGTYLFQAQVRDRAGNWGTSPQSIEPGAVEGRPGLTVRGIAVQPPVRPVTAGQLADFFVDTRGAPYTWRLRRIGNARILKRGRGEGPNLAIHMPNDPSGAYLLDVRSGRWHEQVPVMVQGAKRSSVLIVVPAISWLGVDRVDDQPLDGIPNTLTDGTNVHWPRVMTGLPAQFADEAARLLVFLDRHKIRYDLTTDLDLDLSRNPRASDREGVLLAGPETWVTRTLARRLRRYVLDGGRVASFGADTLRRGVTLRTRQADDAGLLTRPTQPTSTDPFGARLAKPRTSSQPATLIQYEGDDQALMTGVQSLPGFTKLEESLPVSGDRTLLTAVGQALTPEEEEAAAQSGKPARELRPALTAVRVGSKRGLVIRVGLPEWYAKLGDPNVQQVTYNIIDLLRNVTPKIRTVGQ
jgi:N,N-dimethylformamidase beta subunit-like, C-terminal/FlgD Ig-like domain